MREIQHDIDIGTYTSKTLQQCVFSNRNDHSNAFYAYLSLLLLQYAIYIDLCF